MTCLLKLLIFFLVFKLGNAKGSDDFNQNFIWQDVPLSEEEQNKLDRVKLIMSQLETHSRELAEQAVEKKSPALWLEASYWFARLRVTKYFDFVNSSEYLESFNEIILTDYLKEDIPFDSESNFQSILNYIKNTVMNVSEETLMLWVSEDQDDGKSVLIFPTVSQMRLAVNFHELVDGFQIGGIFLQASTPCTKAAMQKIRENYQSNPIHISVSDYLNAKLTWSSFDKVTGKINFKDSLTGEIQHDLGYLLEAMKNRFSNEFPVALDKDLKIWR